MGRQSAVESPCVAKRPGQGESGIPVHGVLLRDGLANGLFWME